MNTQTSPMNYLLVTFDDCKETLLHPSEDWAKELDRFKRMNYNYATTELSPEQALAWGRINNREL